MLQTPDPIPTAPEPAPAPDPTATHSPAHSPDRRHPAPPRPAPAAPLIELAGLEDFNRLLGRHALRSRRDGQRLSALLLRVNFDTDGDAASRAPWLAECARRLCGRVRSTDFVARWQETQFGVLLPRCEADCALAVLERLRKAASGAYRVGERVLVLEVEGWPASWP